MATFRRHPDFSAAFFDVVLAVESVATPLLSPNDKDPLLGAKAVTDLHDKPSKWTVAGLDAKSKSQRSADTLLAMLSTIWQNHQRHVKQGGSPPAPVEQVEPEAVLFLGITVVQLFERDHVQRVDAS